MSFLSLYLTLFFNGFELLIINYCYLIRKLNIFLFLFIRFIF